MLGIVKSITPAVRLTGRFWADATLESEAKARVAKYNNEEVRFMMWVDVESRRMSVWAAIKASV